MGKRKARMNERKPRTSRVVVDVGETVMIDRVGVDPSTSQVFFWSNCVPVEFTIARVEVSYERENTRRKGSKMLARAMLAGDRLWLNPNRALEKFDYLFAIDTNTKEMEGEAVSVSGIVHRIKTEIVAPGKNRVTFGIPFCVEFRGVREKAENIAWMSLIQGIQDSSFYNSSLQIGIIVDSDLDNLEQYNSSKLPIYDEFYIPENMTLIYASSEVRQSAMNVALALAEREAKYLINYIIREKCNQGLLHVSNKPYTYAKRWDCSIFPKR